MNTTISDKLATIPVTTLVYDEFDQSYVPYTFTISNQNYINVSIQGHHTDTIIDYGHIYTQSELTQSVQHFLNEYNLLHNPITH